MHLTIQWQSIGWAFLFSFELEYSGLARLENDREPSAVVNRFEPAARSHDAIDTTYLIISDFKYLQQNDIIGGLTNLWNLTEPVKSSALA